MYRTHVNNKYTFEISNDDLKKMDCIEYEDGKFHIILENRSFIAEVIETDYTKKSFSLSVNGKLLNVVLEDDYDILVQKLGLEDQKSTKVSKVKAPMPGMVLNLLVEEGQAVSAGDSLLILEAMKMENILKSPNDGTIKKLLVEESESVDKNQALIEFE